MTKQYECPQKVTAMAERYECHGHMLMDGADFKTAKDRHREAVDENIVRKQLLALKEAGVTYFRDGGDGDQVSLTARKIAPEYGIEYVSPAFAIHKKGRYGGIVGRGYSDLSEYRALIEEVKRLRGDFVKLIVSGIVTFQKYGELSCPSVPDEEIRELVHIAKEEGFAVMVHANQTAALRAVIESGADSIEHGCFMDEETIGLLSETGTVWVPTIAAIEAFVGREGFDPEVSGLIFEKHKEAVARAAQTGVIIANGSDCGAVGVPHGSGTLREYELLEEIGLTEEQILTGNLAIRKKFHR